MRAAAALIAVLVMVTLTDNAYASKRVHFVDPSGDGDPPIGVDLVSLELAFDPQTGDYELVWEADPAQPFVGTFRLNANLYNPDTGATAQDPAFFQDTFNDFKLTTPQTKITLTGNNPRLTSWTTGDRVAPSCPDPLGCPIGSSFFQTAVGPLSGSAEGIDRLVAQFSVIVADRDGDGVSDGLDNCPDWADPDLTDTDLNGIGDVCECGDQDENGTVDILDILAINSVIFGQVQESPLCDTNDDQLCDVQDILGANAKIFGAEAYCERYPAPAE